MKKLWRAVHNLAKNLDNDANIKEYSKIISTLPNKPSEFQAKEALNEFITEYHILKSQPFLIGWYFCQLYSKKPISELSGGTEFCALSVDIVRKVYGIIEWLRSRLPRYPNLLVPHVALNSNICGQECQVLHRFPWINHIFKFKFDQIKSFSSYFQGQKKQSHHLNSLAQSVDELAGQLMKTEAWQSFEKIANELDSDNIAKLVLLVDEFQERTKEDVVTRQAGKYLYRIAQYKSAILNEIKLKADAKIKKYYEKFEDVEWLLQIVNNILSSLVIYGQTDRIEQYNTFIAERNKTAVSEKNIKINMDYNIGVLRHLHLGQLLYFKNELKSFEGAVVVDSFSLGNNEMEIEGALLKESGSEF